MLLFVFSLLILYFCHIQSITATLKNDSSRKNTQVTEHLPVSQPISFAKTLHNFLFKTLQMHMNLLYEKGSIS